MASAHDPSVSAEWVTLVTPKGNTLPVRVGEEESVDLEFRDELEDLTPPDCWLKPEWQPRPWEQVMFDRLIKQIEALPVPERNDKMIEFMKKEMDMAERAMKLDSEFEGAYYLAKNYHDTMICHRNHGKDLWTEYRSSGGDGDFIHQVNLRRTWLKGREVDDFLSEQL
ncbi:hypothetical protein NMY22_g10221 [Coprinellus aureogranulatus]|nr:hypothetical protein NMY22_g10221 [Coprinellus aureogranulatus]